jgi:UDP-N-acetylmuramoylalanine--D-glutamate ligase
MKDKKVIVIGAARSGISTMDVLKTLGAHVTLNDIKTEEQLGDLYEELSAKADVLILGSHPKDLGAYDLMVLSPGVPTDLPFILEAKDLGVEIIGELELAYRHCKGSFLGITGTNGKTTTTSLVGAIFAESGRDHAVVGNIGLPAISKALEASGDTVMVTELSSFQLESIESFKPQVGAILNLTPDHLNRHKTMAAYVDAKCRIFENQTADDIMILNYDNEPTRELASRITSRVVFFSRKVQLDEGIFVENDQIVVVDGDKKVIVGPVADIFIPGPHNLENVLAAVGLTYFAGIDPSVIMQAVRDFKGVEHRVEFVDVVEGITFYNDSKGTNPDATIQAVRAMNKPTVLIAGGMDKGSDFNELMEAFGPEIKHMVLLGETKDIIEETANKHGFTAITKVGTMAEAVAKSFELAKEGYNVLLSPACASWDMYESYEIRGDEFKSLVRQRLS